MKSSNPPPFVLPKRYKYANQTLSGGQGAVYICDDRFLDRKVAIKALHGTVDDAALVKEIQARGKIHSKHVVEIYDRIFDMKGNTVALVLEYVPGESLFDKSVRPTSLDAQLLVLYQLACGLADMHAAKVIHRDIKPQNMKLDKAGVLKIFDLGISNLDADSASTVGAAGTAVFRAPELYQTLPVKVTTAADVYAIGVMGWFLIGAKCPSPLLEVPPQASGNAVPALESIAPGIGGVGKLLDKALAVDPTGRPTAGTLRDALASRINFGRRRGVLTHNGKIFEVKAPNTSTQFRINGVGSIRIRYDGERFTVGEVDGEVYINNSPVKTGHELPNSCVITYGDPSRGSGRYFVPFDVSQPEIVL